MKTINQYLDDLKEKTGSDYKSAQLMNIERTTLSTMRRRAQIADETAIKIADALGVDRNELLIAAAIARSQGEVKKTWENFSRKIGMVAGFLLVIQGVSALPRLFLDGVVYIMLNRRLLSNVNYCTPA